MTVPNDEILKDERLLEWRLERFAELGFSAAESSELAESEADCHLAAAIGGLSARAAAPDRPLGGIGQFDWRTCHFAFAAVQANDEFALVALRQGFRSPRCC